MELRPPSQLICVMESQNIRSELLEKNDESGEIEEGIDRSNGNLSGRLREDALSTSRKCQTNLHIYI